MLSYFFILLGLSLGSFGFSTLQKDEHTKIVGGSRVNIKDAPFVVLLVYDERPLCGASILSTRYFLTAAHCTETMKPRDLTIRSGSSVVGEGDLHYVSNIYEHPKYNSTNFNYDFSILKISGRLLYDENQRAIKLVDEGDETPPGEFVKVVGWGDTKNPLESSDNLRGVDLVIVDSKVCEEAYKIYKIDIETNKICAGHPEGIDGKDACQGDSGGPMQRASDGCLIGLVSFGLGCADANYPGIYARVNSVRSWIKEKTGV